MKTESLWEPGVCESRLSVRSISMCQAFLSAFSQINPLSLPKSYEVGSIIISIFQMGRRRHREIKTHTHTHTHLPKVTQLIGNIARIQVSLMVKDKRSFASSPPPFFKLCRIFFACKPRSVEFKQSLLFQSAITLPFSCSFLRAGKGK